MVISSEDATSSIQSFCNTVIFFNKTRCDEYQVLLDLYRLIKSLLYAVDPYMLLVGDLVMAMINKNIDINKIHISLDSWRTGSICEWISTALKVRPGAKLSCSIEACPQNSNKLHIILDSGRSVFLEISSTDELAAYSQLDTLVMRQGVLEIHEQFLKPYSFLLFGCEHLNESYIKEDMLTQTISDIGLWRCRSLYKFSSNKSLPIQNDCLKRDWKAADYFYNILYKTDFAAWQGEFPFFSIFEKPASKWGDDLKENETCCCICLCGGDTGVLQTCGHMMHSWCGARYHSIPDQSENTPNLKSCPLCRSVSTIKVLRVHDS